ncbi:vacuolar ATP synthase 16 kDa proteolipid subunit [Drechmeria coniospora]|uniref:Vacuolar ATP synthase 16 kDa proteolipid subunit n=1 Tax=Drechmeria coniospora TaxID=98403 RepID=A0A151GXK3_DRECN|nr:vacuolar ATP synthase 16 kDa proteolipid subunit [Drechmeria coniospora]KYK61801.1 vacuolar ATP synthase 16 kDa proteolipid subunit [Drechmeria coniospora]
MDPIIIANLDRCPPARAILHPGELLTRGRQSFFGAMGCAFAIILATIGASYGTARSAVAIFSCGVLRPERFMQNTYAHPPTRGTTPSTVDGVHRRLCAVMAQILSIYGLVASVIIANKVKEKMAAHAGFLQLGAGLAVGLCCLAAGFAIGVVGDAGVRASTQQPRLYVGMVLILIFAEVLGLYGVVVSILMITRSASSDVTTCLY